jgi:hypothetical protein
MRTTKPKEQAYISFFKDYEVLFNMKKKKSPITVLFCTNDPEKWFINKVTYLTKSGLIHDNCIVIKKDLESSVNFYEGDGFYKV